MLGCVLRYATVFAFFAQAIAPIALLIRNAAGVGSLLCLADRVNEAFPIPLLFRGDFDPLAERAVVDGYCGLIYICRIQLIPVFYFPFDYLLCFVTSVKLANLLFSDILVIQLNLRYLIIAVLVAPVLLDDFALLSLGFCEFLRIIAFAVDKIMLHKIDSFEISGEIPQSRFAPSHRAKTQKWPERRCTEIQHPSGHQAALRIQSLLMIQLFVGFRFPAFIFEMLFHDAV